MHVTSFICEEVCAPGTAAHQNLVHWRSGEITNLNARVISQFSLLVSNFRMTFPTQPNSWDFRTSGCDKHVSTFAPSLVEFQPQGKAVFLCSLPFPCLHFKLLPLKIHTTNLTKLGVNMFPVRFHHLNQVPGQDHTEIPFANLCIKNESCGRYETKNENCETTHAPFHAGKKTQLQHPNFLGLEKE